MSFAARKRPPDAAASARVALPFTQLLPGFGPSRSRALSRRLTMKTPPPLRLTSDLLDKLRHDLTALKKSPANAYVAYDLFATAWHMLEWIHPGDANAALRAEVHDTTPLLQVCAQIARGTTQLVVERGTVEPRRSWGLRSAFRKPAAGEVIIHLQGEPARTLGRCVSGVRLAVLAYEFWKDYPELAETTIVRTESAAPVCVPG